MSEALRPTSPHLSIYRKQITSVLSILHRLTGLALVVGSIFLVLWICTAAYRPAFYIPLHDLLVSTPGKLCLFGSTLAFYYHLSNGIRHLFWDMGMGFSIPQVNRSGWLVVVITLVLTTLTWGYAGAMGGM